MNNTLLISLAVLAGVLSCHVAKADSPKEIVAACLVLEAGGEGDAGMRAVMNVIQNRAKARKTSFKDVVLQRKQFSCFNSGTMLAVVRAKNHPLFGRALEIVEMASLNRLDDITLGADHYYAFKKCSPSWARSMVKTQTIGNHVFYRSK